MGASKRAYPRAHLHSTDTHTHISIPPQDPSIIALMGSRPPNLLHTGTRAAYATGCHLLAVQCCIAAMQCDAEMQVLKVGPLSLFEHDPGPPAKHCFYRPHGPGLYLPCPLPSRLPVVN